MAVAIAQQNRNADIGKKGCYEKSISQHKAYVNEKCIQKGGIY
jgi:hypothetical protein